MFPQSSEAENQKSWRQSGSKSLPDSELMQMRILGLLMKNKCFHCFYDGSRLLFHDYFPVSESGNYTFQKWWNVNLTRVGQKASKTKSNILLERVSRSEFISDFSLQFWKKTSTETLELFIYRKS